jgi:gliding motility-associated-like protein
MYWDQSIDDHTPSASVTYDLMLKAGQQEVEAGDFDLENSERLTVTHGNHGTNNFALQRIPITTYSYAIQPIDNSFTVKNTLIGGGQGGGGCANLDSQTLTTCNNAPIQLHAKQAALWFSFSKGYLGKSDSLPVPAKTDTVFSYIPAKQFSCDDLKVYLIQQSAKDTLKVNKDFTACLGDTTWLTVNQQWLSVIWKDNKGVQKGTGDSLHYIVNKQESLTAIGHNNRGCIIKETENLTASKPSLTLNGEDFKIMLGQSVSLSASGAQEYWWQPADGLNNNTIANPAASPTKTTTYTLIGFDSLHCTAMATVLVEVTPTAFIPTLFTPNGDGKNEELKIYGLTDIRNFQFTIYNREGVVMYETTDMGSAISSGWNGTKNGTPQPPGLYYWKVEGYFDNGQFLMLNGKTKGSIMLIR